MVDQSPSSSDAPIRIDVTDARLAPADVAAEPGIVVLVEPVYEAVAVALALDAGWTSVELAAPLAPPNDAPIPLVSYEAAPSAGEQRCRLRCHDLLAYAQPGMLLGAPVHARPLASMIATRRPPQITLLATPSGDAVTSAAWWACGMLVRVLLEELEQDCELTDGAGIAVTLATGAEDARVQLTTGARWRAHLARGGHPDDVRLAAAIDSVAAVPVVTRARASDVLVAERWRQPGS